MGCGEIMGSSSGGSTALQNALRGLCFNTEWKYAVFWKLKHRTRMVLTWEDAYYDHCEQTGNASDGNCFVGALGNPLGLALAKMSYQVYSLGEGIVGQVAVSGKHQWIFAEKHETNSFSSFEFSDGWQSQFSAGIKTIVVVAVPPHGVVQLGSLSKVGEDMKLVTHVKDVFLAFQDSCTGHLSSSVQCNMKSSLFLPDLPTKALVPEVLPESLSILKKAPKKEVSNSWLPDPCIQKGYNSSYSSVDSAIYQKTADEMANKHEMLTVSASVNDDIAKLLQRSNLSYLQHQVCGGESSVWKDQIGMNLVSHHVCGGEAGVWTDRDNGAGCRLTSEVKDDKNFYDAILPSGKLNADLENLPVDLLDPSVYSNRALNVPESPNMIFKNDSEMKFECQAESNHLDTSSSFLNFSAGCELHEALGPAFFNKSMYIDCGAEKSEAGIIVEMPEDISSSQMTFDHGPENLLEAVVANACTSVTGVKSDKSACKSVQSLLTTEKMSEPSKIKHVITSGACSVNQCSAVDEEKQNFSNLTEVCGAMSSKGFSSTCPSVCSEQLDRRSEPTKNKKRARTGENSRPRPRDRQLIQDRIKELRELVPNGSKCSIDSLLERTIKHMLFLESITKHADKLNKCAESKMHQKGTDASTHEQGSSWAVEVGGYLKISSIVVENLNKNGQMLVEMLCEECSHFLEIAEAIRSLGLTILKGITGVHSEKTWICFVVEGQNNRVMRRMDILWSLMQILQPNATN